MTEPAPDAVTPDGDNQPGFAQSMTELRGILERLDRDDVDLDELSGLVERAARLIRVCRRRIVSTEMRVQEIIDDLDADLNNESGSSSESGASSTGTDDIEAPDATDGEEETSQ